MFREYLSEDNIVLIDGTSEGTQVKYRKGDYWYKEDNRGKRRTGGISGVTFSDIY